MCLAVAASPSFCPVLLFCIILNLSSMISAYSTQKERNGIAPNMIFAQLHSHMKNTLFCSTLQYNNTGLRNRGRNVAPYINYFIIYMQIAVTFPHD